MAFQKESQDEFQRSYPDLKAGMYIISLTVLINVIFTARDWIERSKSQHKLFIMENYSREWKERLERTIKAELQGYFIKTNIIKEEVKDTFEKVERPK